ncbi:hypothetical protein DFP72DRAFT_817112 [Ephemerocybe angulata]|uniref:Uncharacterized protein n=1 Tax=Ephemerocybe angulata TaxID=980116 RepID=A0A8H6HQQ4_9AGAR|nr:hypothetical protein DFP72DRAFT_817112 [Tulosesus angulatus]
MLSIHPAVLPTQYSAASALAATVFTSPKRIWVPQQESSASSPWKRHTASCNASIQNVAFDYIGSCHQGVLLRDLLGGVARMQGPGDQVFAQMGVSAIRVKIMWPGYTRVVPFERPLPVAGLTRAKVGLEIARLIHCFLAKSVAPESHPQFAVGPSKIPFERLVLVSIHKVANDVWQADIAYDS